MLVFAIQNSWLHSAAGGAGVRSVLIALKLCLVRIENYDYTALLLLPLPFLHPLPRSVIVLFKHVIVFCKFKYSLTLLHDMFFILPTEVTKSKCCLLNSS